MSRKWELLLCGVIMLALALVVARVFREPLPPLSEEESTRVGDSVSGTLQSAPQASLPAPLPSPEAMIMRSGDSDDLPVTHVEPQVEGPTGVAPVVKDAASGLVQVTEPPLLPAEPVETAPSATVQPGAGDKPSLPPSVPASSARPAREADKSPAPVAPVPEKVDPVPQTMPPSAPAKPEAATPPVAAGAAAGDRPSPSPGAVASPSAKAPAPAKAAKPLKPGTLVTQSSLPAKAGGKVVTAAVLTMDGDVVTLNLQGTGPMRGKTFMLAGPDRVVLDIEGDWKVEAPRVPGNRMVRSLRVGSQGTATRLVFDMKVKPVKAGVTNPGANSLELTIR